MGLVKKLKVLFLLSVMFCNLVHQLNILNYSIKYLQLTWINQNRKLNFLKDSLTFLVDLPQQLLINGLIGYSSQIEKIPVTSCSCKRLFSKFSIVKSKLCNTMTQNRLEALLLMFVEQELLSELDYDNIMYELKNIIPYNRRLILQ